MRSESNTGPWTHRWLIILFTFLLGMLFYWLLGFVVSDIGSWEGPQFAELESTQLDPALVEQAKVLKQQIAETERQIQQLESRQRILRDSTTSSQTTMNQLLDLQRLNLQRGVTPTDAERDALSESEHLFLANQRKYQQLNEQIATLSDQLRISNEDQRTNEEELKTARQPIWNEFNQQRERHRLMIAAWKLAFLTPLLLVAVVLYVRQRSGTYWAVVYAFGSAVLLKVGLVMHEYFPARYFKYVLILVTLAVTLRALVYLLRMVAYPKQQWLVKQYREAYESFLCPICSHPIRRGPLKYLSWTRRSIRRLSPQISTVGVADEPYTCPACSTTLYEKCESCSAVRHALLPACEHCGSVKRISAPPERGTPEG